MGGTDARRSVPGSGSFGRGAGGRRRAGGIGPSRVVEPPAGMLSILGNSVSEQNALIISSLLMDRGAVNVPIALVPTLLSAEAS